MKPKEAEKRLEKEIEVAEQMLEQKSVVCEFCGQMLIGRECDCYEAKEAQRKAKMTDTAINVTLPMLTDEDVCKKLEIEPIYDVDLLEFLRDIIVKVGNGSIEKATIKVDDETVFSIVNRVVYIEIARKESTSKVIKLGG